ncbi:ATP-binding cassette domain-containing protein [Paenibacillus antri]|uniref:ATP-binding cassette domain-containing protein n=1 Tax=Paenibacillus antri TaxID=2582848 RepID=A0A5R9GK53_9BACL|nr:ATP-binding cassette domain-containing protein [Paenibacillus antri]TLS53924.1 ATP-binding cassette domain-containing protein [Paenibacillus antri]
MGIITVKDLEKDFQYYMKGEGLKSSFQNLFRREQLTKKAVKRITFEIEEGEIVGFLGPNGAGKTTTLKMLSGILHPTSGSATVMGYVPWERKNDFKRRFSIVMGQKNQLWPDLPAHESLYLNKCIYEVGDKEYRDTLNELTELLQVKEQLNVQVRRLSLGERMKMEFIAALIHKPSVLLLDEPTIGLDLMSQRNIRDFLKYYNERHKMTIVLTSHYLKDIEHLCKRSIIVNHGRIMYDGSLGGMSPAFSHTKRIKVAFSERVDSESLSSVGRVIQEDGYSALIEVDKSELNRCSKILLDQFPILDITIEDIPIEESIAAIYQREEEHAYLA